ncbi:MAG: hypothetical protein I8H77_03305 [Comamonadaceae bacterium]|nr:hypothetical protein [Comamonadaceae bacterium]
MTTIARSAQDWRSFISGSLEFRPEDNVLVIQPVLTGGELAHEGLYVNQHSAWHDAMQRGLDQKIKHAQGAQL